MLYTTFAIVVDKKRHCIQVEYQAEQIKHAY